MRTPERTTAGTARKAYNKPDGAELPAWNDKGRNDNGTKRCRRHFLTTTLNPIAIHHLVADCPDGKRELITQENYEFLRDSYLRYAELMNVEPHYEPTDTSGDGIFEIYCKMAALAGDGGNLNLEQADGQLYFNLWKHHQWGKYTLYYFPVRFIEGLSPKLKKISISFMHRLMHSNGLTTVDDEWDTECVLTGLEESINEQFPEDAKRYRNILHSYKDGKAAGLLHRIWKKSYYRDLPAAIAGYTPQNNYERNLIEAMHDGLEFISGEKSLMDYAYDPYFEEQCDYPPISLERQVRLVYDTDDMVSEGLIDYFNSERCETYEIVPVERMALSPDTERLFSMENNYPERFFLWAERFINIVT